VTSRKARESFDLAAKMAKERDIDVFLYNGEVSRAFDYKFIDLIDKVKKRAGAMLYLITNGGDPDAGYKIARHFQTKYKSLTVVVSGMCKSAGTLIAIGADHLVFTSYGELGPLDIQTIKTDDLAERQSGLTIQEALDSLAKDAINKHGSMFTAIIRETGAVVSFQTAAKTAADLVTGLYAPIFAQIDPYDVGEKARAMRIATEYGKRLAAKTNSLKQDSLNVLTRTYPSHSFVIDMTEAQELFSSVRLADVSEAKIADGLGLISRSETNNREPVMVCLSVKSETQDEHHENKPAEQGGGAREDTADSRRPKSAPSSSSSGNSRRARSPDVEDKVAD